MLNKMCVIDWAIVAAWVQAIGSIVAIAIAIWVPFKLNKLSSIQVGAEKSEKALVVQATLLPIVYRLRTTTKEFVDQQSGEPSIFGVERDFESFDSDFCDLIPELTKLLTIVDGSGSIKSKLTEVAVLLFKTQELMSWNARLQRDGHHAAWQNHKDIFVDAANKLHNLSDEIANEIELKILKS